MTNDDLQQPDDRLNPPTWATGGPAMANEALKGLWELVERMEANALPPHKDCTNGWAAELKAELENLAALPHPAMLALESLTPGGSEYVGDIKRCVATIRETRLSLMNQLVKVTKRVHELENALPGRVDRDTNDLCEAISRIRWAVGTPKLKEAIYEAVRTQGIVDASRPRRAPAASQEPAPSQRPANFADVSSTSEVKSDMARNEVTIGQPPAIPGKELLIWARKFNQANGRCGYPCFEKEPCMWCVKLAAEFAKVQAEICRCIQKKLWGKLNLC